MANQVHRPRKKINAGPVVRGVVAEVGGTLSHAATVAREYGLPVLANVNNATRLLKNGDRVWLDANGGVGMTTMTDAQKQAAFAGQPYLNLESYRKNGQGVRTPLWFAEEGGALYVSTPAQSWKVKRIRRNPRVRIVPSTLSGAPRGEWVEATARLEEAAVAARAQELLIQKYGWQKKLINFFGRLAGRKSVVISLHLNCSARR